MRRRSPHYVLCLGVISLLVAGKPSPRAETPIAATERWIVMFRERGFDLTSYRQAIRAHRPAGEIAALTTALDSRAEKDQQPFASVVRELGGRVLHHWWLVNGCAVELPSGMKKNLLAQPNVLRIERDAMPRPGESDLANDPKAPATGAEPGNDHGVAAARARGIDGHGVAIAILDTGQDEDCGGSGSPHPIYAANGNGPGIAGSRLVRNFGLGSMPKDDRIGHGTAVAAIAAGRAWSGVGACDGHAPGAGIAGYAIAERADGATSDTTLIEAWQQVARDRQALGLVGANNSYCGSPDPTSPVQQALDSAAYNADLLITVCAYNTGNGGTRNSQSACNGLAVGAVTADDHAVCSYSARGPIAGDARRTYPDLCAVASMIGPSPDCAHSAGARHGTSFAAPQVLGAAALVRQAAPQLSALETKAILLAATADLADANPDLDRNATGLGLLRDDCAVATALDQQRHRSTTVGGSTPVRIAFPVEQGKPCAVAIAWHRTDFGGSAWADIDLVVRDGDRVVATARSPRNLYEHLRLLPQRTGTLTAEIHGRLLPGGPVEVAFACAELPPNVRAASYRTFGRACASSTPRPGAIVQAENGHAGVDDLQRDVLQLSATEWLFEFTAPPNGIEVRGFEALAGVADGGARIATALYRDDGGRPRQLPEVIGSMVLNRQPGWVASTFVRPVAVPGGQRYYLAISGHGSPRFCIALQHGAEVHAFYRWPCSGEYVDGGRAPVGFRVLGGRADRGLEPQLGNADVPALGDSFAVAVSQTRPHAPLLLATEVMSPIGVPGFRVDAGLDDGCAAYVAADVVAAALADRTGAASIELPIPADPRLCGVVFRQQMFAFDPAANAVGIAATAAGEGRIGERR